MQTTYISSLTSTNLMCCNRLYASIRLWTLLAWNQQTLHWSWYIFTNLPSPKYNNNGHSEQCGL